MHATWCVHLRYVQSVCTCNKQCILEADTLTIDVCQHVLYRRCKMVSKILCKSNDCMYWDYLANCILHICLHQFSHTGTTYVLNTDCIKVLTPSSSCYFFMQINCNVLTEMLGSGLPSALQLSLAGSFLGTTTFCGCSVMEGCTSSLLRAATAATNHIE